MQNASAFFFRAPLRMACLRVEICTNGDLASLRECITRLFSKQHQKLTSRISNRNIFNKHVVHPKLTSRISNTNTYLPNTLYIKTSQVASVMQTYLTNTLYRKNSQVATLIQTYLTNMLYSKNSKVAFLIQTYLTNTVYSKNSLVQKDCRIVCCMLFVVCLYIVGRRSQAYSKTHGPFRAPLTVDRCKQNTTFANVSS